LKVKVKVIFMMIVSQTETAVPLENVRRTSGPATTGGIARGAD
jgi:hypothetical protein